MPFPSEITLSVCIPYISSVIVSWSWSSFGTRGRQFGLGVNLNRKICYFKINIVTKRAEFRKIQTNKTFSRYINFTWFPPRITSTPTTTPNRTIKFIISMILILSIRNEFVLFSLKKMEWHINAHVLNSTVRS